MTSHHRTCIMQRSSSDHCQVLNLCSWYQTLKWDKSTRSASSLPGFHPAICAAPVTCSSRLLTFISFGSRCLSWQCCTPFLNPLRPQRTPSRRTSLLLYRADDFRTNRGCALSIKCYLRSDENTHHSPKSPPLIADTKLWLINFSVEI